MINYFQELKDLIRKKIIALFVVSIETLKKLKYRKFLKNH